MRPYLGWATLMARELGCSYFVISGSRLQLGFCSHGDVSLHCASFTMDLSLHTQITMLCYLL